jgi:Alw26I/Eco31I/Esp3I family type II restriction m6 adenine DNA methyltransferase
MLETLNHLASAPQASYAGKTLAQRANGRFYTPDILAVDLAAQILAGLNNRAEPYTAGSIITLADPFCGDGRLITAVLQAASLSDRLASLAFHVVLQDIEPAAVDQAHQAVLTASAHLGLRVKVRGVVADSFLHPIIPLCDAVITNPPWELLKPDSRETSSLSPAAKRQYLAYLRERSDELDSSFPESKADKSWAGWGTNLARCGWEVAIRSCRKSGILGIILPSSILSDQASLSMRRSVVERCKLMNLAAFPPEARLFAKVDQPVIAATFLVESEKDYASRGDTSARMRMFDRHSRLSSEHSISWSSSALKPYGFGVRVGFGAESATSFFDKFRSLPTFGSLEGTKNSDLWAGRELDETNLKSKLVGTGRNPFLKGRTVVRHSTEIHPEFYVPPAVAASLRSVGHERLVWRDVARASQKRRMVTTLVPPGWVTGNSLHVAHFRKDEGTRLRALYAIASSFVFEFQVRALLSTGHMSLGVVRQARIPSLTGKLTRRLGDLAERVLTTNEAGAEERLEVAVALAYGLDRDEMAKVLSSFPKVDMEERDRLLDDELWRTTC